MKEFDPDFNLAKEVSLYSYWVASVVGPVVYILAVIHALLWKQLSGIVGSIVSSQSSILMIFHITAYHHIMSYSYCLQKKCMQVYELVYETCKSFVPYNRRIFYRAIYIG